MRKGSKQTKEARLKMSLALRGKKATPGFSGRKHTEQSKKKTSESLKKSYGGGRSHNWKGGRTIDIDGYVLIYKPSHPFARPSGYVFEHRLIAEKALGRYLRPNEVVHHINSNTKDNHNKNLLICYDGYHHSIHAKIKRLGGLSK